MKKINSRAKENRGRWQHENFRGKMASRRPRPIEIGLGRIKYIRLDNATGPDSRSKSSTALNPLAMRRSFNRGASRKVTIFLEENSGRDILEHSSPTVRKAKQQ